MKRSYISILGTFIILMVLPKYVYAYDFVWTSPPEDRSIEYLGQIFGSVGTALQGEGNTIIAQLFRIFNIAVLSLGSIVVSYTIILSTINTAQEGEVMGRKWSSVWIPLRAAIGMGMLLPTLSGYSLIQVMMMQIVIYGIAAANQVWAVTVAAMGTGGGAFGATQVTGDRATPMRSLLKSVVCGETINNDPDCRISFNNKKTVAYTVTQGTVGKLYIGFPDETGKLATICGGLQSSGGSVAYVESNASWIDTNKASMISAANALTLVASNFSVGIETSPTSAVQSASNMIASGLMNTPLKKPVDVQSTDALKNGWLFAGSFYFELIKVKAKPTFSFPTALDVSFPDGMASDCTAAITTNMAAASTALPAGTGATPSSGLSSGTELKLTRSSVSSDAGPLYDLIADAVKSATVDIMNTLTKGGSGMRIDGSYIKPGDADFTDPVSAMRNMGSSIMTTCENIWFAIIACAFLILILGCLMSGVNPLCWALGAIITVLTPVLTLIIGLLWGAGAAIGIYLPMVPYLVFTFTALGWMLLVIETIAAAPIVALGLVSPAQENLGKASASVMLITNVFLRPSLMVIGFVLAVKLVTAAITMVNFGFMATVNASTGNIGIFGCIALLCLYGGMCIGIIHECFSLVYVLPDKITRWIGGQAEQSNVKQQLDEAKGAVDKGAEIGGGLMKSSAGAMSKVAKQSMGGGGISDLASG